MSATFPMPDEPEDNDDQNDDQNDELPELSDDVTKDFNAGLEEFLRQMDAGTAPDAPEEREPSVSTSHTTHKDEQTYRVTLDIIHQYVIDVTAASPEEATKKAMENYHVLQPEVSRAHIASVENVMPMTVARLEASFEVIRTSDLNDRMKRTKAIEIMHDIKSYMEKAELEDMDAAEVDRLQFLQTSIISFLTEA